MLPLESQNYDLSFEWYYNEGSYLSVGYFKKDIDNYVGVSTITATPFNLPHPGQGAYFDEAVATGGCPAADLTCVRNYIFDNHAGAPGVTGRVDSNGSRTGIIAGRGDDIATLRHRACQPEERQLMAGKSRSSTFGASGFGVSANVTLVDSDLTYDNQDRANNSRSEGSPFANFVAFYERAKWSVRGTTGVMSSGGKVRRPGLPNPVHRAVGQPTSTPATT